MKRVETGNTKEGVIHYFVNLEGDVTIYKSTAENIVEMYYDHESNTLLVDSLRSNLF